MATAPTCIIAYTREDGSLAEVRAAAAQTARTVPSDMERPGLVKRMRGETAAKVLERAEAAVAVVHRDARVEYPEHKA